MLEWSTEKVPEKRRAKPVILWRLFPRPLKEKKIQNNKGLPNSLPYVNWNNCQIAMLKFICCDSCHVFSDETVCPPYRISWCWRHFCTFPETHIFVHFTGASKLNSKQPYFVTHFNLQCSGSFAILLVMTPPCQQNKHYSVSHSMCYVWDHQLLWMNFCLLIRFKWLQHFHSYYKEMDNFILKPCENIFAVHHTWTLINMIDITSPHTWLKDE